jgi:transcriptional regulator with GAF, ATPase, and Fis domain
MSGEGLEAAVRAVAQFLVADVPLGETLDRVAVLARDSIKPAEAVGITLLDERGRPVTAVYTDEVSPAVDRGQYLDDEGPCLDAFRELRVVRVDDTREVGDRWPRFSEEAVRHGVLSTLSFPLTAAGDTFGAFDLYAPVVGAFDDDHEAEAQLFVTQVSLVLANARAYWGAFEMVAGLEQALRSRAVVEQAKGKVMAANSCSPDEAFAILVRVSQRENVRLRDVARQIVEGSPSGGPR